MADDLKMGDIVTALPPTRKSPGVYALLAERAPGQAMYVGNGKDIRTTMQANLVRLNLKDALCCRMVDGKVYLQLVPQGEKK